MRRPWLLLGILIVALALGFTAGRQRTATVDRQELFRAVERWLAEARVPPQDMPKAIIAVERLPNGHYRIHMQMRVGEGWFEVWQEGSRWQVKGLPPP